jgi:uncharacterized membrane protein YccC
VVLLAAAQAAQDMKWTDIVTALGTSAAAVGAVAAAVIAIYIAAVVTPRESERAVQRTEERQRRSEEEAEDRRFRSAALLVLDEVRANLSALEIALKTGEIPQPLAFETYAAYQLLLAQHLTPEYRDDVRAAYVYARVPRVFQRAGPTAQAIRDNVEAARKKTERAIAVLGWVAEKLPGGYKDL